MNLSIILKIINYLDLKKEKKKNFVNVHLHEN